VLKSSRGKVNYHIHFLVFLALSSMTEENWANKSLAKNVEA
jgi:hypothetical protein